MSEDLNYNTWTTADLQSLFDEIAAILEERYGILQEENNDEETKG